MELPRVGWRAATAGGVVVILGGGWWWWVKYLDDRTVRGSLASGDPAKDQGDGGATASVPPAVLPDINGVFPG